MISEEALDEFKRIYKKEFGTNLPGQEALEKATNLLNLFRVVYRPIKKDWDNLGDENGKKATKEIIDKTAERLAEILIKQVELKKTQKVAKQDPKFLDNGF